MTKNIAFLQLQTEKVVSEIKMCSSGVFTRFVCAGAVMGKNEMREFADFKFTILDMIKIRSEEELDAMYHSEIGKLCINCQKGIETFDLKCEKDLKQFVLCEYIKRAVM